MVQLNVWTGTKWVNIFDGNDMNNMNIDLHRVAKVVDDQVVQINDAVKRADDAVEQAGKAVDSSNVNKAAIDAANSAIAEAKQSASDAVQKLQSVESSVNTTSDEVTKVKQSQADQIKQVTNQLSDAVTKAKAATDSLDAKTEALQTAVTNAQSDATVATQTASEANLTAINAASDAATAKITASGAAVTATNAQSDVVAIQATASAATITAGNAASDALTAKATASSANLTATNAKNDVAQISATADSLSTRVTAVESKATANSTAIDENAKAITLKADQTTVDALNKTVTDNSAAVNVLNGEITSKVDSTTVNKIVDGKGFATTNTVQSLVDQKASQISQTIADVKTTVDGNGNAISTANDKISNLTQTIDGIQTTVKDKADQSQITQLSNALQVKLSGSIIAQATDVTLTYTGEENEYPPAAPLVGMNDVDKGSTLILSFDYVASADTKLTPQLDGDPWIPWGDIVNATPAAKGEKGSYSKTITVNDDSWQKGNAKNLCIRCDGFKGTIEITNLVLKYADTTLNDVQSSFDMLRDDINLRVTKGDLISQINLEAGGDGLISVQNGKGKLMLDAGSVVFGNEAFIPSAAITNIQADKITSGTLDAGNIRVINLTADNIHGGTLDVGNMHVKNFSANDIETGILSGVTIRAGDTTDFFQTSKDNIYWITDSGEQSAVLGKGTYIDFPGFNIFDSRAISLGTYPGSYLQNGTIEDNGNSIGHPQFNIELPADSAFNLDSKTGERTAPLDNSRISGWVGPNEYFHLEQNNGFYVRLNQDNNASQFKIQKDNHFGAYFGQGDQGNQINLACGDVNVTGNFHATGSKNSIVNTKQGYLAINAYETAEYYFGDIGEDNTGNAGQVVIGIDRIFNETVNTDIQYQVFVTPYSDAHVWVKERYNNRFVVCSDKPNAEFGWELKAKRKGYESNRLRRVSVDVNPLQLKGETK